MGNRFFVNGEIKDNKIVAALKQAARDYENGEIEDVRALLLEIAAAIDEWASTEYGD